MNSRFLRIFERPSTQLAWTAPFAFALTMVFALAIVATPAAQGQTFQVIHNFTGGGDGAGPAAGLTLDIAGNLYGTAQGGGVGYGVVFKLRHSGSAWVLTPLYSFGGGSDGSFPDGRVAVAQDGTLYGTTSRGGSGNGCQGYGCGTVFRLTPSPTAPRTALTPWSETVFFRFTGGSDGAVPSGDLTFDQSGNVYGTAGQGGLQTNCSGYGCGVVYELTPSGGSWTETVLYSFEGYSYSGQGYDGSSPSGGVVFDRAGNLYGATANGGQYVQGEVYQLSPSGSSWTEQILYSFTGHPDGWSPTGGLIMDSSGNLYGATTGGGNNACGGYGCGTVFEVTPNNGGWSFNTLYQFTGLGYENNCGPWDKLLMDDAGSLYGTTFCGGPIGLGTVFKLTPSNGGWAYTDLHDFTNHGDGYGPIGSVMLDANGNLYGTAFYGGANGHGIVWEITP